MIAKSTRRFSRIRALAAVGATAALVAACGADTSTGQAGSAPAEGDPFKVGIVALDATQITALNERTAAQKKMKEIGWETTEINSDGDPAKAISAMQNLVQSGVNAIIVQTYTPDQLAAGLAAAKAADIPVFSTAGGLAGGGEAGAVELVAAANVNDKVIEAIKDKPKVELLQLRYTPGAPCRSRAEDLDAKLSGLSNVNVTRQEVKIPGGEQSAQEATAAWLQAHPDDGQTTFVIWPCFSEAAIGAVSAEKQAGRGPYELYTWDISKPAIQAIKDGYATGVLWIQVDKAGEQIVEMIKEWRDAGGSWQTKNVTAPSVLLTKDNIDQTLQENPELQN
ncbi:sugar ABC transporter substrate-binding protein [Nonomuraea sp. CA-218870]|uniref:sugar ABC transporter substrate-binding protein n=1 Tax=Nonomuraea sp. CA-218870 TaxID=3239998 RepID=UPI003D90971E